MTHPQDPEQPSDSFLEMAAYARLTPLQARLVLEWHNNELSDDKAL